MNVCGVLVNTSNERVVSTFNEYGKSLSLSSSSALFIEINGMRLDRPSMMPAQFAFYYYFILRCVWWWSWSILWVRHAHLIENVQSLRQVWERKRERWEYAMWFRAIGIDLTDLIRSSGSKSVGRWQRCVRKKYVFFYLCESMNRYSKIAYIQRCCSMREYDGDKHSGSGIAARYTLFDGVVANAAVEEAASWTPLMKTYIHFIQSQVISIYDGTMCSISQSARSNKMRDHVNQVDGLINLFACLRRPFDATHSMVGPIIFILHSTL